MGTRIDTCDGCEDGVRKCPTCPPADIVQEISAEQILKNIGTHFEELVDDEMKEHAGCKETHSLDFQVFRLITGYQKALDQLKIIDMADPSKKKYEYKYKHSNGAIMTKPAFVVESGGGPNVYFDSPFVDTWWRSPIVK